MADDGWVSVKDRLPEPRVKVLLWMTRWREQRVGCLEDANPADVRCWCDSQPKGFDYGSNAFGVAVNADGTVSTRDVSHWHELPAPPKETANG